METRVKPGREAVKRHRQKGLLAGALALSLALPNTADSYTLGQLLELPLERLLELRTTHRAASPPAVQWRGIMHGAGVERGSDAV
jgi:hypothetical protein